MTYVKVLADYEVELIDLVLLSGKELHEICNRARERQPNMPMIHFFVDVRCLQFYLKNLQEKGFFSFEREFNFSSIDRREL